MTKRKINYDKSQVAERCQPTLEALSEVEPFFWNLDENLHLIQYEIDSITVDSAKTKNTK